MALTSVSVYELSRLSSNYSQQSSTAVRRRSNSTKIRRKGDESLDRRRRSHNQNHDPITITYLGRPRSPSVDHLPTSPPIATLRNRRLSPAALTTIKKIPSTSSITATPSSPTKKISGGPNRAKKPKSVTPTPSTSDLWNDCIEVVTEIGLLAKRENKNMRRLRIATSRRIKFNEEEEMVLIATRILSRCNGWTLDTCHEYLGVLIDNITSIDNRNRSIALEGLASISDNLTERLLKFANISAHRIGVDVAAEDRAEKAKTCILLLRSIVKKRDWYYRQLDEESVDKLDATMERLKTM